MFKSRRKNNLQIFRLLTIVGAFMLSTTLNATVFAHRPEVIQFIDEVVQQHKIDKQKTINALSQIATSDEVIKRISTQYESLPWHKYRAQLITENKILGGVEFWRQYSSVLQQAQEKFGVPAGIIVAIIGIESTYGKYCGKYSVLQSLATLAFDYPPRAAFFKDELKHYLILVNEHGFDPLAIKGSFAGAMGMPQFIPSSHRNFAVDFDNSGAIDLVNNIAQVIGSVANYFKVHGWQPGKQVIFKAETNGEEYKKLLAITNKDPKPVLSLTTLTQHGIKSTGKNLSPDEMFALLEFDHGTHKEHWIALDNFYVITRYNRSSNYALAVYQLSLAIDEAYKKQ